jgi:hypothetical protein
MYRSERRAIVPSRKYCKQARMPYMQGLIGLACTSFSFIVSTNLPQLSSPGFEPEKLAKIPACYFVFSTRISISPFAGHIIILTALGVCV